jgi:hypothetical protein
MGVGGSNRKDDCCVFLWQFPLFFAMLKILPIPPASDVTTRLIAPEKAPEDHRWWQGRWLPRSHYGAIPLIFYQSENLPILPPLAQIFPIKVHRASHMMW